MAELAQALDAFINEVCSAFAHVDVPHRQWVRALPAQDNTTTHNSVWRFEYAPPRPDWDDVCHVVARQFELLPTVERVRAAAVALPIFPTQADNGGVMWVLNYILMPILQRYFSQKGNIQYDGEFSKHMCHEAEAELQAPSRTTIAYITPVLNIHVEADAVEFEPDVLLRHATRDEIERWLNQDKFWIDIVSGRILYDVKNVIDASTVNPRPGAPNAFQWALDRTADVVTAIRLVVRNDVYPAFNESHEGGGLKPHLGYMSRMGWRPRSRIPTKVDRNQIEKAREVYAHIQRNKDQRIKLAVRRWENASDRFSAEDRLIDYWIGLEALFSPSDNQEVKYRASLRIAAMMGGSPKERTDIFDKMRHSYDWRSTLVHGGSSERIAKLKRKRDLPDVESETNAVLRSILLRILASPESFVPASLEERLLEGDFGPMQSGHHPE